jgi:hypothetical protein
VPLRQFVDLAIQICNNHHAVHAGGKKAGDFGEQRLLVSPTVDWLRGLMRLSDDEIVIKHTELAVSPWVDNYPPRVNVQLFSRSFETSRSST